MKKSMLLLSSCVIIAIGVASCSDVYEDKYGEAMYELGLLKNQYAQLKEENDKVKDQLNEAQQTVESLRVEIDELKDELNEAQ